MMYKLSKLWKKDYNITSDTIMCFDIEVSSYWVDNGNVIEYSHSYTDEYLNSCDNGSLVYIFQFSIDDDIYYSRYFKDFERVCKYIQVHFKGLNKKDRPHLFIHNASYEFQFLRNLNIKLSEVFARDIRKPMKFLINDFIEVRCTYFLTNLSLAQWGKQLGVPKMVGDLDYNHIYTPQDKLNDKQLAYCEHDLLIMIKGLKKYLLDYKHLSKIPLTSTGEVRRPVKKLFHNDMNYHRHITALLPKDSDEEKIYKQVFNGGDAKGNALIVGDVVEDGDHIDETSAYPSMIVRKQYPQTPFIKCKKYGFDFKKYAYIFYVRFKGLKLKPNRSISYISKHRCISVKNAIDDNGRIVSCDMCTLYMTELDYITALQIYDYTSLEIVTARRSKKGYLDSRYIDYVLELFEIKSQLKGTTDEFELDMYQKGKNKFNSLYGLMVQSIIQPIVAYNDDWTVKSRLKQDADIEINDLKHKPFKNYLAYIHGIWVTAWARYELWRAILKLTDLKDSTGQTASIVWYFDTDSIFYKSSPLCDKIIEELNAEIIEETKTALRYHNFDENRLIQRTKTGEVTILGTWTYEPHIKRFCTLGAKKYLCEEVRGDSAELVLTVSGVPKKAVGCLRGFEDFKDGFIFDREHCGKNQSHYIDGDNPRVTIRGYRVWERYGINIRPTTYKLGRTTDYKNAIHIIRARGEI